jgi:hypothetical protein
MALEYSIKLLTEHRTDDVLTSVTMDVCAHDPIAGTGQRRSHTLTSDELAAYIADPASITQLAQRIAKRLKLRLETPEPTQPVRAAIVRRALNGAQVDAAEPYPEEEPDTFRLPGGGVN